MASSRWVVLQKFCGETGITEEAARGAIAAGHWLEGVVWQKAPNGRIFVDPKEFDAWVEGKACAPQAGARFKSSSGTAGSAAAKS